MRRTLLCTFLITAIAAPLAWPAPTPIQLSREAALYEVKTEKKNYHDEFQDAREEFDKKYGTGFAILLNYVQQVAVSSQRYEGKSLGSWYYNAEYSQRLWPGSRVIAEVEGGGGKGIDKCLRTFSTFDGVGAEPSTCYMPVFYLKQKLFDDRVYGAGGRLDLTNWFDTNAVANTGDTQFLSSSLINNLAIPFPTKGTGFMAGIKPVDWFYAQAGMSDSEAFLTRIGIIDAFHGKFIVTEVGLTPKISGLQGNYRFILSYERQRLPLVDGSGYQKNDYSFGVSFDQEVTKDIALFFRYGLADEKTRKIANFWSMGFQWSGIVPKRKNDCLGFGVAQSITGNDFRRFAAPGIASAETMVETYYSFELNQLVTITPDIQVVIDPSAQNSADPIVVAGVRALLLF